MHSKIHGLFQVKLTFLVYADGVGMFCNLSYIELIFGKFPKS